MKITPLPLGLTMGDPSGIGPEIIVRALDEPDAPTALVIGSCAVIDRAAGIVGTSRPLRKISRMDAMQLDPRAINVFEPMAFGRPPAFGVVAAAGGREAYECIVAAIRLAREHKIDGIVTAPIHKAALAAAGIKFPGHTEMLAHFGGAGSVAMMLANDEIRVVLVTIHSSLRHAIEAADHEAQLRAIRLAHSGARALGIARPRVAVAGLNPHAGESGLFGDEEIRIIAPAIAAARAEGIDATGPWPGDTVFMTARKGGFDVVVAQYHDQGLIPVKYMGLERGVNITLGLPFVRTSPDHGTAFDIAGTGRADATSMITAIAYAATLVAASKREAA